MKYKFLCKQVELADSSKEKVIDRIKKLEKFFDTDEECKVCVAEQGDKLKLEITFLYKGFVIRSEAEDRDLMSAVDECMSNIDRQIRKYKTKLAKRLRSDDFKNYDIGIDNKIDEDKSDFNVIKVKRVETKPMLVEEAILQMNMLGHDFFVFENPETAKTNIVYKRKDGNYALIEA